ncbi:MAG TPA: hypothetical protein VH867_02495 [Burkholderiales bacterium]|jgi:hypothetical protein
MTKWLLPLVLFSAYALAEPNAYEMDAQAYADYLNQQYNAGRITKAQMEYMMALKDSELRARAGAAEQRTRSTQFWRDVGANQNLNQPQPPKCSPSQSGPWGQMDCR